jgi:hypothetical protein
MKIWTQETRVEINIYEGNSEDEGIQVRQMVMKNVTEPSTDGNQAAA